VNRLLLTGLFGTLLSACTSVVSYTLDDGRAGYQATCSAFTPQQCADVAAQQCPQGYVVLVNPRVSSESASKLVSTTNDANHLDFSCKSGPAKSEETTAGR
jgi:hypothetical protein